MTRGSKEGMEPRRPALERVKGRLERWRETQRLTREWRLMIDEFPTTLGHDVNASASTDFVVRRVFIVPGDPRSLVGSLGDEAMIGAVLSRLSDQWPHLDVGILTASQLADDAARLHGFTPMRLWDEGADLRESVTQIRDFKPDAVIVVGADILDGYYSVLGAIRALTLADLCGRSGFRTIVLGFSFNKRPHQSLRSIYSDTTSAVSFNLRDRLSLERFSRFSPAPGRLVADAAFLLRPDRDAPAVQTIKAWVGTRRAVDEHVIAFNLHPMLIRKITHLQLERLVGSAVVTLTRLLESHRVSVVLLSHDKRPQVGDDECLRHVYQGLASSFRERVLYPTQEMNAAQVKGVVESLDGVVSGRMHLAIASLGTGVPAVGVTYQDKFDGLFDHFELPQWLLVPPRLALQPDQFFGVLSSFIGSLDPLRRQIQTRLPSVIAAAERNLDGLIS